MRTASEATARDRALHTRPYHHRVRRLVLLAVAASLLAACASDDTTSANTTSVTTSTTSASTSAATSTTNPANGSLDWITCPDAGQGFECSTLTVPVDYDDPTGATIDLALIRLPAGNTSDRIGTLLVNPGSLGLPFETYVSGGPPRILAHAEYATVDAVNGSVDVTLHRVPVDRGELIAEVERWDNPLQGYLLQQYRS